MTFVCLSDTHNLHHAITVPQGDVLLHAGDVSSRGNERQVKNFLNWFSEQPHRHKIFIAGNHDFYFENTPASDVAKLIPNNIIYLNDSGTTIENIHIWGSPIQPWFYDWAFNRQRGVEILKHWELIPKGTDILMTHGPAYGCLDKTTRGHKAGCLDLLHTIRKIRPRYSVCGHIHEARGIVEKEGTVFINASVLDEHYQPIFEPIVFDFSK